MPAGGCRADGGLGKIIKTPLSRRNLSSTNPLIILLLLSCRRCNKTDNILMDYRRNCHLKFAYSFGSSLDRHLRISGFPKIV